MPSPDNAEIAREIVQEVLDAAAIVERPPTQAKPYHADNYARCCGVVFAALDAAEQRGREQAEVARLEQQLTETARALAWAEDDAQRFKGLIESIKHACDKTEAHYDSVARGGQVAGTPKIPLPTARRLNRWIADTFAAAKVAADRYTGDPAAALRAQGGTDAE